MHIKRPRAESSSSFHQTPTRLIFNSLSTWATVISLAAGGWLRGHRRHLARAAGSAPPAESVLTNRKYHHRELETGRIRHGRHAAGWRRQHLVRSSARYVVERQLSPARICVVGAAPVPAGERGPSGQVSGVSAPRARCRRKCRQLVARSHDVERAVPIHHGHGAQWWSIRCTVTCGNVSIFRHVRRSATR